ncbi:CAP domain-containing protein [Macrococcus armenti]|uniref:CAP domain-containing protein n=1 Tax=Macrococcus armenti TaxID=2875764 RepID=A0ABY3ZVW7_9STAP|nr:CAP domain-containing protein [Macrococcus armenti]UOB20937.1 CAP domain-containing protein [Macrococcus armenti]
MMKKLIKVSLASALLFTGIAAVEPTHAEAATVSQFNAGKAVSTYQLNMEILKLINNERRANGVAPLQYNTNKYVLSGTNTRAYEVTKYFSHYRPNGTLFNTAFASSVKPYVRGENVMRRSLRTGETPTTNAKYLARVMFEQWKQSPDHRQNMLRKSFKKASLSVKVAYDAKKKKNYYYAVQIFTTK